jgi:carbonic anhydrase
MCTRLASLASRKGSSVPWKGDVLVSRLGHVALVVPAKGCAASFSGLSLPSARQAALVAGMNARLNVYGIRGVAGGEEHVIRGAGGVVTGHEVRSLAISQCLLGTRGMVPVRHVGCGTGQGARRSAARITASPFVPHAGAVRRVVFDVATGKLS